MKRLCKLILLLLLPLSVTANDIYRGVDPAGNVEFSDRSSGNGEKIQLPPQNVIRAFAPPEQPTISQARPPSKPTIELTSIKIVAPLPDQALRNNNGNITLIWETEPELPETTEVRFQISLNGKIAVQAIKGRQHTLNNVDRGTHTLRVQATDQNGEALISSHPITVHLHRFSRLHRAP